MPHHTTHAEVELGLGVQEERGGWRLTRGAAWEAAGTQSGAARQRSSRAWALPR